MEVRRLQDQATAIATQLRSEDERIETLTKTTATGSVRLQIKALLLLGLGALFSAAPNIATAISSLTS